MYIKMDPEAFKAALPKFESLCIVINDGWRVRTAALDTDAGKRKRGREYHKSIRKIHAKARRPCPEPILIMGYLRNFGEEAEAWRQTLGSEKLDNSYKTLADLDHRVHNCKGKSTIPTPEMQAKWKGTPMIRSTQKGGSGTAKRSSLQEYDTARRAINKIKAKAVAPARTAHNVPIAASAAVTPTAKWFPQQPSGPPPPHLTTGGDTEVRPRNQALAWHRPQHDPPTMPTPPPSRQRQDSREANPSTSGGDARNPREDRPGNTGGNPAEAAKGKGKGKSKGKEQGRPKVNLWRTVSINRPPEDEETDDRARPTSSSSRSRWNRQNDDRTYWPDRREHWR